MTREGDLEGVRLQGKRLRTAQVEVRYIASPLRRPRVGVIVPRFGHTAVDRNRLKRRLRTLVRTEMLPVLATLGAMDVSVRATPRAYASAMDALRQAVASATRQLQRAADGAGA